MKRRTLVISIIFLLFSFFFFKSKIFFGFIQKIWDKQQTFSLIDQDHNIEKYVIILNEKDIDLWNNTISFLLIDPLWNERDAYDSTRGLLIKS